MGFTVLEMRLLGARCEVLRVCGTEGTRRGRERWGGRQQRKEKEREEG